MKNHFIIVLFTSIFASTMMLYSQENSIITSMNEELSRSMKELSTQKQPPYFLSYMITNRNATSIAGSLGKLEDDEQIQERFLDIDIRVGDYILDNTHTIRGNRINFTASKGLAVPMPLTDNPDAIKAIIWYNTDKAYKAAEEQYMKVKTNIAVKVSDEDTSADFSTEQPLVDLTAPDLNPIIPLNAQDVVRLASQQFRKYPFITNSKVYFQVDFTTKYFVNSEGSKLSWSEGSYRVFIIASTKADDGMVLPLFRSFFAHTTGSLPSQETLIETIDSMATLLAELKKAPLTDTYSGPAILSGEASGVFFHEIFGHRVEGHRQKDPNSSQTFKGFVGKPILPDFIDVIFDPTIKFLEGREVHGYVNYDDQGVKGKKVVAVENGIFKEFLMSRSPIESFPISNGHGRKQMGYIPVSRQSNLIVSSRNKVSVNELKNLLRNECIKQNKEYGLYFVEISGGFTFTSRTIPNSFTVQPLVVYKIYADGRPDELVRGVDMIGTPLTTFQNIVTTGDDLGIFNGICGAESGNVPVSASSPSILVSSVEVQKKSKSQAKPPILDSPNLLHTP